MSTLVETLEQIDRQVAERVQAGACGCGCWLPLDPGRKRGTMFVSKAHAQRIYDRRLKAACRAVGQPCRVNLQLSLASNVTRIIQSGRNRATDVPHKPSGMQVPYYKAIDVLTQELGAYVAKGARVNRHEANGIIRHALTKALPERQREILQGVTDLEEAA